MGELIDFTPDIILSGEKTDQEWIDEFRKDGDDDEATFRQRGVRFNKLRCSRGGDHKSISRKGNSKATRQILEAAGRSYSRYSDAGTFVTAFPTVESQHTLSISVCLALLPARNHFLYPKEGDPKPEAWRLFFLDIVSAKCHFSDGAWEYSDPFKVSDVKRQVLIAREKRHLLTSTVSAEVSDDLITKLDTLLEGVDKQKSKAIKSAMAKEIHEAQKKIDLNFEDEVNTRVAELAKLKASELIGYNERKRLDLDRDTKLAQARAKGLPSLISKADYRYLLQLLHTDRAPDGMHDKYERAFDIVKKVESGSDW